MNYIQLANLARQLGGRVRSEKFQLVFTGVANPTGTVAFVCGDGGTGTSPILQAIGQLTGLPASMFFDTATDAQSKLSTTTLIYLPQAQDVKRVILQRFTLQSTTNFAGGNQIRFFQPFTKTVKQYSQTTGQTLNSLIQPQNVNDQSVILDNVGFPWIPGNAFSLDISLNEVISGNLEVAIIS